MLYDKKELPEIYFIKHLHDDDTDYVDYENNILNKTLSPYIYENSIMAGFLDRLQPILSIFFDQMNIMKNFRNITVDKYYFKHKK
jgi:hypothetical protein